MAFSEISSKNPAVLADALEKVQALPAAGGGRYRLAYALRLSYESDNESLPLAASDVIASMTGSTVVIFGDRGIGKTTLASMAAGGRR